MMNLPLPVFLLSVAVRTGLVILVLIVSIRLFGKREMGDLNLFDIVLVLLLGNAIQNAITYGSGNLGVGLVSAGTLLIIDRLTGDLFIRHPAVENWLVGEPVIIAEDGKLNYQVMKQQGVSEEEVQAAMRQIGIDQIDQVHLAILEDDGDISVIPVENEGSD